MWKHVINCARTEKDCLKLRPRREVTMKASQYGDGFRRSSAICFLKMLLGWTAVLLECTTYVFKTSFWFLGSLLLTFSRCWWQRTVRHLTHFPSRSIKISRARLRKSYRSIYFFHYFRNFAELYTFMLCHKIWLRYFKKSLPWKTVFCIIFYFKF